MRLAKLTLPLILAMTTALSAQDKLDFKLNLEAGTGYIFTMDVDQTITQTVEDEQQTLVQQMLVAWDYDVLNKNKAGEAEIGLTYRRVKVSQDYGHQQSEYDSDNPPAYLDPSMKGLAALPGSQLRVRFDRGGKVLEIKGIDEMLDKMIKSMELPDSPQKEMVIDNLRTQFGRDAMEQSLEQIAGFYPSKPVSIGESWNTKLNMTSGFPMTISSDYTLKSRADGVATIDVISRIASDSSSNTMTMGLLTMAYNIDGGQDGVITVDESTGLPVKSELSLQFSGSVRVSGVPDQEPQTWPISAAGSVVLTFQEK